MSVTLNDVYRAIDALYYDADISGKEKASWWLGEFQKSVFAWKLSDELLQQNRDVASSYFAAQTMRTKIQFSFDELPLESHHLLRDSLIQHICTTPENNSAILTQLCLALADLALQMASWKTAVRELIQQLGTNVKFIPALLEILIILPDEFHNKSLRLSSNRREEIMDEFYLVGPMLLQLLVTCTESFETTDSRIQAKILSCFGIWLGFGALPTVDAAESSLLVKIFRLLGNCEAPSMLHEAASDCICEALVLVEEENEHAELKQVLLQSVHALIGSYYSSVKAGDNDKCTNFCRVFSELAKSFMEDIFKTPDQGMGSLRTLDIVLVCLENGDREAAEITFDVWYQLSEFLRRDEHLMNMFKPYIVRLIAALCSHCKLEPGLQGVLEDDDDLVDFRIRFSELIKDVVFISGSSDCFRQLFDDLKNQATWEVSEATLFVMCAVAETICPDQNKIIPDVLGAILNLPDSTHVAILLTSVQLVGVFHKWIEQHPQSIEPVLNFMFKSLHRPQLATMAAIALEKIYSNLFKRTVLLLAEMPFAMISQGVSQLCRIHAGQLFQTIQDGSNVSPINSLGRLTAIFSNIWLIVPKGETHPCAGVVEEVLPILSETCTKFQHDHSIVESCCTCVRRIIRCVGRQSESLLEPVVKLIVPLYRVHQHACYLHLGRVLVDECGVCPALHKVLVEMMEALCGPTFVLLAEGIGNHPDIVVGFFRLCLGFEKRMWRLFFQSSLFEPILQCGLAACSIAHEEANESVVVFLKSFIQSHRVCREVVGAWLVENGALLVTNLINACISCQQFFMIPDFVEVIYELVCFDRQAVCAWLERPLKDLSTQNSGGNITHEQLAYFMLEMTTAKVRADVRGAVWKLLKLDLEV